MRLIYATARRLVLKYAVFVAALGTLLAASAMVGVPICTVSFSIDPPMCASLEPGMWWVGYPIAAILPAFLAVLAAPIIGSIYWLDRRASRRDDHAA